MEQGEFSMLNDAEKGSGITALPGKAPFDESMAVTPLLYAPIQTRKREKPSRMAGPNSSSEWLSDPPTP